MKFTVNIDNDSADELTKKVLKETFEMNCSIPEEKELCLAISTVLKAFMVADEFEEWSRANELDNDLKHLQNNKSESF